MSFEIPCYPTRLPADSSEGPRSLINPASCLHPCALGTWGYLRWPRTPMGSNFQCLWWGGPYNKGCDVCGLWFAWINASHCSRWKPLLSHLPSPGGLNKQQPLIPHTFPWCLNVLHCHYIRCPSYMHPSLERDI